MLTEAAHPDPESQLYMESAQQEGGSGCGAIGYTTLEQSVLERDTAGGGGEGGKGWGDGSVDKVLIKCEGKLRSKGMTGVAAPCNSRLKKGDCRFPRATFELD